MRGHLAAARLQSSVAGRFETESGAVERGRLRRRNQPIIIVRSTTTTTTTTTTVSRSPPAHLLGVADPESQVVEVQELARLRLKKYFCKNKRQRNKTEKSIHDAPNDTAVVPSTHFRSFLRVGRLVSNRNQKEKKGKNINSRVFASGVKKLGRTTR